MTDMLSSPSTTSGNSSGNSSRSRGAANAEDPYLVIHRQPPTYAYSNESFDVEIVLETPEKASSSSLGAFEEVELNASLYNSKTGQLCGSEASLITQPSRISLRSEGTGLKISCIVRCMIRTDMIRREHGTAVELRFAPRQENNKSSKPILGTATNVIHLVNYKIKLFMEEEWDSVWYKDEGGRDKSMEVFAAIYDKDGQIRTGEQIPLQPILCYDVESGTPTKVGNQEILRTLGSMKIVIDKDSGKARIRFRVEDVSKNHQAQDFRLQVGTEPKAKGFKDVAPAYSPSVNVRSKRNKRSRKDSGSDRAGSIERRPSPVAGRPRGSYGDRAEMKVDAGDIGHLREAMKGLIDWTDEVVNGLYPLQWQVLGYAQHPDGTPDYSRPYHNMPNPNPCISRILSLYSDSVREGLRVILNAVESAGSPRSDESPTYFAPDPVVPREHEGPYGTMRSPPLHMHAHPLMSPQMMGPIAVSRRPGPGMHPSVTAEAFRDRPDVRAQMPPSIQQGVPPFLRVRPGPSQAMPSPMDEGRVMMHGQPPIRRIAPPQHLRQGLQQEESSESQVEYVLAKHYKSLQTGERLGFPAYSASKEILGFYRESSNNVGVGQFSSISQHHSDFGPLEIMQATEILDDAIAKKSESVHCLKNWGNISNLLDHALVYDWSKEIDNPSATAGTNYTATAGTN